MQETQEQTIDLRGIINIIRKGLGLILFSTFVVLVLGSIYTFLIATPVTQQQLNLLLNYQIQIIRQPMLDKWLGISRWPIQLTKSL